MIIQAISNYLTKHDIEHDIWQGSIGGPDGWIGINFTSNHKSYTKILQEIR